MLPEMVIPTEMTMERKKLSSKQTFETGHAVKS